MTELTKIEFKPGLIKDETPLASEGGWIDAQWVRFKRDKPEVIGGYTKLISTQFTGKARAIHAWLDLQANKHLAIATADRLYHYDGSTLTNVIGPHSEGVISQLPSLPTQFHANGDGTYSDGTICNSYQGNITALPLDSVLVMGVSASTQIISANTTASGYASYSIYVYNASATTDATLKALSGTTTINGGTSDFTITPGKAYYLTGVGGAYTTTVLGDVPSFSVVSGSPTVTVGHNAHGLTVGQTVVLSNGPTVGGLSVSGTRTVASVVDKDTWTFTHGSNASSTASSSSPCDYVASWRTGLSPTLPAVCSLDHFGEMLLFNRRGDGLYGFQPASSYPELILTGGFSSDTNWAKGTGWTISGGVATKTAGTASNLSQNVAGLLTPGYVYRVVFTVTRSAGSLQFRINAGATTQSVIDVGQASTTISTSGTYSRLFFAPSDAVDILFSGDSSFAGTVDNVSIKLENVAFRFNNAPTQIDSFFMDPNRVVVACGCTDATGVYNPNLVRWSDQENVNSWVPTSDNMAGEYSISSGGRVVAGVATKGQNLILTDDGGAIMRFLGSTDGFSFQPTGSGHGLIGRNALAESGVVIWLSNNGNFYLFDGGNPRPIDCPIRRDVFDHVTAGYEEYIFGGMNSAFGECWFWIPDSRDATNECSRYAAVNYTEGPHWTAGTGAWTAWLAAGIYGSPLACGADGYIYKMETGHSANGSALAWSLESGAFNVKDGNKLMRISRIAPDIEEQSGDISFYVKSAGWSNETDYNPNAYVFTSTSGPLNFRREARQMKIRMTGSSTSAFMRLGCLRIDAEESGAKR